MSYDRVFFFKLLDQSHNLFDGPRMYDSNLKFISNSVNLFWYRKYNLTRIEPVGKPYREVCLQTLLWPWNVHQPSSWSLYLSVKIFFCFFFFFLFFLNDFFGLYWTYFQQMYLNFFFLNLSICGIWCRGLSNWSPTLYRLSYAGQTYRAIVICCIYI